MEDNTVEVYPGLRVDKDEWEAALRNENYGQWPKEILDKFKTPKETI